METCGPYKIVFETGSGDGWASFLGRDEQGEVLITVFTSGADIGRQVIDLQQQASAASPHVASVIASGECEWGRWYATRSYPRSVAKLLEGRVELNRAWLLALLLGVTRGALAFKKTCGRSHGNLYTHNILLGGTTNIKEAEIVIKDPVGGESASPAEVELRDLKAIGLTLHQLVRRREIDERSLILPLELSPEWKTRFGKDADRWVSLCNRLLDPGLSTATYSLERLEEDLIALEPKAPVSRKQLVAAAVVLVAVGIVGLIANWWSKQATLEITTNLPGATVTVKSGDKVIKPSTAVDKALTVRVRKGTPYQVESQRPGYPTNLVARAEGVVASRKHQVPLQFQFATLSIVGRAAGVTKYSTNLYAAPGPVRHDIVVNGYQIEEIRDVLTAGQVANVERELKPTVAGEVRVEIRAVPRTAMIEVRKRNGEVVKRDQEFWQNDLPEGAYTVLVTYEVVTLTNNIVVANQPQTFRFEIPTQELKLLAVDSLTSLPVNATISHRGKVIGETKDSMLWPIGTWDLTVSASGYEAVSQKIEIKADSLPRPTLKLTRILAEVAVKSDPATGVRFGTNVNDLSWQAPANVLLPPGPYYIYARHEELGWITNSVVFVPGKTNAELAFGYGMAKLTANLTNVTVAITPLNRSVVLKPDSTLVLAPGTYSFKAVYLPSGLTNEVLNVTVDGTHKKSPRPIHFDFEFARAVFVSSPELGADVYDERGVFWKADGATEWIVPRRKQTFHFVALIGKDKKTNRVSRELLTLGPHIITNDFSKPPGFKTPFGMEFAWLEHLTSYVAVSEVTQSQYQRVMPLKASVSPRGPNFPVNYVTYEEAKQFCVGLHAIAPPPDNYEYRLPTAREWMAFAGNAFHDEKLAVMRTNALAEVCSRGANDYGLCDVRGNVSEITLEGTQIGSGFLSRTLPKGPPFLELSVPKANFTGEPGLGFRVILAPRRAAAVANRTQ